MALYRVCKSFGEITAYFVPEDAGLGSLNDTEIEVGKLGNFYLRLVFISM